MLGLSLKGTVVIKYRLRLKTGLHIGGAKDAFEIGGIDNPVIKLSAELNLGDRTIPKGAPYIPGSSLKGKIRSLLEWSIREPKGLEEEVKTSVEYMYEKAKKEYEEAKAKLSPTTKDYQEHLKKLEAKFRSEAGNPCDCGTCSICKMFGVSNVETLKQLKPDKLPGPPRVEFSEAYPTKDSIEKLKQQLGEGLYTELKM